MIAKSGWYEVSVSDDVPSDITAVLSERDNTVTENAIMAAVIDTAEVAVGVGCEIRCDVARMKRNL